MSKKIVVKYDNRFYTWYNNIWTSNDNLVVNTSLAQRLMIFSIKNGFLSSDDFDTPGQKEYKQITKTEEDLDNESE